MYFDDNMRSTRPRSQTGAHLMPDAAQKDASTYTKASLILYRVTSAICTFLFLTLLFICALFQAYIVAPFSSKTSHQNHQQQQQQQQRENSSPSQRVYSPEELKLVPDIGYYFGLLNLQVQRYDIVTEDGFVLSVQRLIDPYESIQQRQQRQPVLLLHGLLQSSGSFCSGGKDSLAYFLFKNGKEVWLGNNRCGFEPRHMTYTPTDYRMWAWDITDMAKYDLTAIIDHALANCDSKASKLALICHSQGTTQGFINLDCDRFSNSSKISSFIALSPAVYAGPLIEERFFIKVIAKMSLHSFFFGVWSFMPLMMTMRTLLVRTKLFGTLSYTMFNYLFDWDDHLWDRKLRSRHFLFSPVHVSVNLMSWWLNDQTGFKVSKAILRDDKTWFNEDTPKLFLVIPRKDRLVDGQALVNHLQRYENPDSYSYIFLDDYSHLDVLWSQSVIEDVAKPVLEFINSC